MANTRERKGSSGYRFLVLILNIVLGILVYWLLGFVIDDIGNQPGPDYAQIKKQYQEPRLVKEKETLDENYATLSQAIDVQAKQQALLQNNINSFRDTMNQLLDLQKASVQKGASFSAESQQNLAVATKQYLDSQRSFQDLNNEIAKSNAQAQGIASKLKSLDVTLSKQAEKADKTYQSLATRHNLAMAGLKLLVLVPLLIIVAYIFKRYRTSIYKPMILAVGIAIIVKIAMVMHEYFPSRFFKYILILALIYIIGRALISLLKNVAKPQLNWLLKQYREAYEKLLCPICQFRIQPSVLKFLPQNKQRDTDEEVEYLAKVDQYNCPSCGERLYEKCSVCNHTRHSLLMYCDYCGTQKKVE